MQAAGHPLCDLVGLPQRGIGRLATARLLADKATRDQIVLFEPALASFLRRIVRGVDIHPWYCEPSRYLVVLPPGWSAGADVQTGQAWEYLAQRCPPLHRHLAPAATRKTCDVAWWEFPDCDLTSFGAGTHRLARRQYGHNGMRSPIPVVWSVLAPVTSPLPCFCWGC